MSCNKKEYQAENVDSRHHRPGADQNPPLRVACPHYDSCKLGKRKAKNNRYRCYGCLIEVVATAVEMAIAYKCPRSNQVIPMVIRDGTIRHLKPEAEEHQRLKKLLKPIKCQNCQQRVFDAHVFYGQARIHIKCHRDKKQLKYDLAETH